MCAILASLASPAQLRPDRDIEGVDAEILDRIRRFSRSIVIVYDAEEDKILIRKFGREYSLREDQLRILQDALVDMCILDKNI